MGFTTKLSELLGGSVSKIVKDVAEVADRFIQTKEEKDIFQLEMIKVVESNIQKEGQMITDRWISDNNTESWLTKNIRPLTLGYLVVMITVMAILDASMVGFTMNMAFITLFGNLLMVVVVAYFGGRSIEKRTKTITGNV